MKTLEIRVMRRVPATVSYEECVEEAFYDCSAQPRTEDEWLVIEQDDGNKVTKIPLFDIVRYSHEYADHRSK